MVHTLGVEARARLVKDEHLRVADELARHQDAPGLAGREGHHVALCYLGDAEPLERVEPQLTVLLGDLHLLGEAQGTKKPAHHDVDGGKVHADLLVHGGAHHAEGPPHVGELRTRVAAKAHGRLITVEGEDLPGKELYERGLARAVGAEKGNVLALVQREVVNVEDGLARPHHACVVDGEERRLVADVLLALHAVFHAISRSY